MGCHLRLGGGRKLDSDDCLVGHRGGDGLEECSWNPHGVEPLADLLGFHLRTPVGVLAGEGAGEPDESESLVSIGS